jgi:hypothetical protein
MATLLCVAVLSACEDDCGDPSTTTPNADLRAELDFLVQAQGDQQAGLPNALLPLPLSVFARNGVVAGSGAFIGRCDNVLVRWEVRSGNGSVDPISTFGDFDSPDRDPVMSTRWTLGPDPGPQTVAAMVGAQRPTAPNRCVTDPSGPPTGEVIFTASAARPALMAASGDQQADLPGAQLPLPLVAALVSDPGGAPIAQAGLSVRFTVETGGGAVEPATAVTDASGRAQTSFILGPEVEEHIVRAELVDFPDAAPARFTEMAFLPRLEAVNGDGQLQLVGTLLVEELVAALTGPGGERIRRAGLAVRFVIESGDGTVEPETAVTDAFGEVSTRHTLGPQPGQQIVRAELTAFPDAVPARFTENAFRPALAVSAGDRQSALPGSPLPAPLVAALVTDPGGEPIAEAGLTVRFIVETGGGTVEPDRALTDASGRAQTSFTLGPGLGQQIVRAELVDIPPPASGVARFTEFAVPPEIAVADGDEQEGEVRLPLPQPLVARLEFAGQPVREANRTVRFTVETGSGSVSPVTALTSADGEAATTFTLGPETGEQVVRAELIDAPPGGPVARFKATANRGPPAADLAGRFAGPGTARVNSCNMSPTGTFAPTILVGPGAGQLTWRSFLDLIGNYQRLLGRFIAQASTMSGPIRITEKVDGEFSRVNPPADMRPRFRGDLTFEQENTDTGARCETTFAIDVIMQ